MRQQQFANKKHTSICTTIVFPTIVVLFFLFACDEKKNSVIQSTVSPDSIAFMSTYGVNTLISDSGRISYRVEAEEWHMYDKRNPPHWAFEKGIYLEKFNDSLQVETTLRSDTAYFFDKMGLWKLLGNVQISNSKGEKIFTHEMYWSSDSGRIYSDKYIKIEQQDQVTEGVGFSSNQNFTNWQILNTTGIYPIEE